MQCNVKNRNENYNEKIVDLKKLCQSVFLYHDWIRWNVNFAT